MIGWTPWSSISLGPIDLCDQLDTTIIKLARHQSPKSGRIKQIIDTIPGMSNLPRLAPLSSLISLISDDPTTSTASFVENETEDQELVPIEKILNQIHSIGSSVLDMIIVWGQQWTTWAAISNRSRQIYMLDPTET